MDEIERFDGDGEVGKFKVVEAWEGEDVMNWKHEVGLIELVRGVTVAKGEVSKCGRKERKEGNGAGAVGDDTADLEMCKVSEEGGEGVVNGSEVVARHGTRRRTV